MAKRAGTLAAAVGQVTVVGEAPQSDSSATIPVGRVAAFYAACFGVLGVVLPFLGPYLHVRGISPVGIGLITAAFSLARLVYTPFLGSRVDRGVWFRGLLPAHVALALAGTAMLAMGAGPWLLGVALLVIGLGYGSVLPLVEAAVLERLPASGYGALRLWGSIGFVVVATAAGRLLAGERLSLFPALLAGGLLALGVTCWHLDAEARPRSQSRSARLPPIAWVLLALLTAHQVAHGPYYAFFSVHLREGGLSSLAISALWSVGVVAELVAFLASRRLEAWLGLPRLLGLALALTPLRWILLSLPVNLPLLLVAQCGHAATFALVHLAGVQLVQRAAPAGATRHAQALYSGLSFGLGMILGSALAGPLYAAVRGPGSFTAAAVLSGAILVAWLVVSRRRLGQST